MTAYYGARNGLHFAVEQGGETMRGLHESAVLALSSNRVQPAQSGQGTAGKKRFLTATRQWAMAFVASILWAGPVRAQSAQLQFQVQETEYIGGVAMAPDGSFFASFNPASASISYVRK